MSNLLNNGNKKKLLNRGPAIVPETQFDISSVKEEPVPKEAAVVKEKKPATKRKIEAATITSVRVTKHTRNRLNAIIQYGKAENVDMLIDILLDEYIETHFTKDDKKTYELILKLIQARDK